ncbi:hypothetical protein K3G63_16275 [Hymenobacter sp. HSC-4F20]|uniref:hypothetical protein n=1 Tax=Hymenobacter sp. HSC-4F20 TaxID=2864135 RepID=UPI001C73CC2B|nr:hypothetical protein [Hymenobacter sp. HSC-4F20]MBX0292009.1 hypothetical protein [Hymenobacter sp. HSC-4F20]
MTDTWIKAYLAFEICVNLSFFLPAVLAWRRWPYVVPPLRVLALLTVFTPAMFGLSRLAITLWKYNLAVGHATTIGEGMLYLWYFRRLFTGSQYAKYFPALQWGYAAFALLDSFYLEGFAKLNSYTNGLESFLCIGLALLFFEEYLRRSKVPSPAQDPAFISNCAILIYMTSTVTTYLFLNRFIALNDAHSVYRIFFINLVMLLILSAALTFAFLLARRPAVASARS